LYEQYGADKITYILASWCSILMIALLTAIYFAFSERKARRSISLTVYASNHSNRGKKRAVGVNKNHKSRKKSSTSTSSSDSETEPIYQKNFRIQSQNDRDMVVCSTPTEVVSRPVQVMTSSPISITAPSKFSADKNPNSWLEEFDLYCEASSCRQNKHKILLYYLDKETREMVEDYGYSEDSELAYLQMTRQLKKIYKKPQKSEHQLQEELHSRLQRSNENGYLFYSKVKSLAERAYQGETQMTIERAARKQFIHGLRDDETRRHLKTHPDYTLKEVLDYVESIDSTIFEERGASFSHSPSKNNHSSYNQSNSSEELFTTAKSNMTYASTPFVVTASPPSQYLDATQTSFNQA
jgi:hypothetical protein